MNRPKDLEPEAFKLLLDTGFVWDHRTWEFQLTRQPELESTQAYRDRSPTAITYEELRDHNLISGGTGSVDANLKAKGLQWLRQRLNILKT